MKTTTGGYLVKLSIEHEDGQEDTLTDWQKCRRRQTGEYNDKLADTYTDCLTWKWTSGHIYIERLVNMTTNFWRYIQTVRDEEILVKSSICAITYEVINMLHYLWRHQFAPMYQVYRHYIENPPASHQYTTMYQIWRHYIEKSSCESSIFTNIPDLQVFHRNLHVEMLTSYMTLEINKYKNRSTCFSCMKQCWLLYPFCFTSWPIKYVYFVYMSLSI